MMLQRRIAVFHVPMLRFQTDARAERLIYIRRDYGISAASRRGIKVACDFVYAALRNLTGKAAAERTCEMPCHARF
jgi:hypothetical protein